MRGFTLKRKIPIPCASEDTRRTEALGLYGYTVLRLRNEQVLADPGGATDVVLAALVLDRCNLSPSHRCAMGPSLSRRERGSLIAP